MWIRDSQTDFHDIGGGTEGMSQHEETLRVFFKTCRETCLVWGK
jgi:hypothetical protein